MELDFEHVIKMAEYDDSIVRESLAKGIPVYYTMPGSDEIIKEYPDGRKEVIDMDESYKEYVVRTL